MPAPGTARISCWAAPCFSSLVLLFAVEKMAETRSPKPLAQVINSHWQADAIIVGFQHYSQALSFYTGQPLYLFQTRGELEFGLQQQPENPYYLHWPANYLNCCDSTRIFLLFLTGII